MQTFLPFPDFDQTARCLDDRRLGNQRNEALVLLRNITGINDGWKHHPAVKMWDGHEYALFLYLKAICEEYVAQGHPDTVLAQGEVIIRHDACKDMPWWIGHEGFHASHRSNLIRKKPEWYGKFGWVEPNDLPYLWPKSLGQIVVGNPAGKTANKGSRHKPKQKGLSNRSDYLIRN